MLKRTIDRLLFVYNANSGKWNAILDGAKKLLAVDGCPLCSLTHGVFGEKAEWRACKDSFGVPVEYVHRNELSESLRDLTNGQLPCVVARIGTRYEILAGPDVLDRCGKSIAELRGRLVFRAAGKGLEFPRRPESE